MENCYAFVIAVTIGVVIIISNGMAILPHVASFQNYNIINYNLTLR